jgi:pimeloyl-ACP methyl ester carboxylesterase
MDSHTLQRAAEWRLQAVLRRANRSHHGGAFDVRELTLTSTAGYAIAARITRIAGAGPQPGLVVSPGIHQGLKELDNYGAVVNAEELAGGGFTVLTFDPAGRGESWGEEDYGGPEHQDDVRVAFAALRRSDCASVGVLALSLGIAAATGALARWPELDAAFLLDWEGPCDRQIITSGGKILVPAAGHSLQDDAYWQPREAVRQLAGVQCPYIRLQALPDHAQPTEVRHAMRMAHAAHAAMKSGHLPWFQLNDHPRNEVPPRPRWLAGGPLAANVAIRRKLRTLKGVA